ncbi:hypothetical protein CC86DRAFT_467607 [Ophiobolus disseminans]|uniref:Uncharacterized protein n=1 Tax=Ophiobolus disseminans TaxID=1469910 RepID=A0A6A6ZYH4_9PLEO|nr:hypothetical protein CC86DRAFT_467607 [Ophiobolus disseminans]
MQLTSFILAAAAAFRVVQADFMVYTVPPIPTDQIPRFTDPAEASGWTLSVLVVGNRAYTSFTNSLGSTYQSSRSSAASEIAAFARSASNYTIPSAVTDDRTTTTFFSRPNWYTALPSGARAFKEQQVSDQFSVLRSVIGSGSPTASSTGAAFPTAQAFLDAKFGAMAAVAAAVFL